MDSPPRRDSVLPERRLVSLPQDNQRTASPIPREGEPTSELEDARSSGTNGARSGGTHRGSKADVARRASRGAGRTEGFVRAKRVQGFVAHRNRDANVNETRLAAHIQVVKEGTA
ncbi:hypothetical protein N0V90_013515 [Kalmusia sp. IMI 367209]|nr:hypothetical protein N0V90_013515 [Kalmusia sp. IMI 367209]